MANRLKADKAEKKKPAKSDSFKPEKEAQVSVKQLVKDERTHKITGAIFLLMAFLLFDNKKAIPKITTIPISPVNLSIKFLVLSPSKI